LSGREVAAVECIRLLSRGKASVLADRPGIDGVHRGVRTAQEWRQARSIAQMLELRHIIEAVIVPDLDLLRRAKNLSLLVFLYFRQNRTVCYISEIFFHYLFIRLSHTANSNILISEHFELLNFEP